MILEIHNPAFPATLRTVFTVFAAFWVTVLVVLFVATGALTRKAEKLRQKHGAHH
jgi:hypothetical protein